MTNDTPDNEASNGATTTQVANVAVKLPPLSLKNPSVWFRRAEAKFRLSGIKSGVTMADHTLSAMSEDTIDLIQAWLAEQPDHLQYEDLKDYILKRFSLPASERAQRVLALAKQPLGDSTARERWEEMQSLLILPPNKDGNKVTVSLEREVFLQSLPDAVRQALPDAHAMPLDDLINQADKLLTAHKATGSRTPAFEVSATNDDDTEIFSAGHAPRRRTHKREDSNAANTRLTLCFYHARYGDAARKCQAPCAKAPKNGQAGRQ